MVCEKCEKKLAKNSLATPEVRGIAGSSTAPINKRKIGENKLLSSKNRYTPYASSSSSASKPNQPPHSLIGRCLTCKANVARPSAKYCQACACKPIHFLSFFVLFSLFTDPPSKISKCS
ncbi:hypothetical protein PGT21_034372 [Puccinia graminis f. sp. tritici]|uniref:Cysteine-rich PDZ-binding protein n=1 Tax=Puccinia graminis f. sp. tritici TaxID=56615 RepID=A0A5B0P3E6_PUCGR|nr:hypothetical protein PGTUg99_020913 [Puccinia graminis f. sp. tritici]KAA1095000.1 hypothetical protein PGT21_034372 [Puccinia graminis f. sp. tritici]